MAKKISRYEKLREEAVALWEERFVSTAEEPSRLRKFIHFWVLVIKSFIRNRGPIRASALSYTTLLALIPMLAVALAVTSSLLKDEGEERISKFITQVVSRLVPPAPAQTNAHTLDFNQRPTPLPSLDETPEADVLAGNPPVEMQTTNAVAEALTNALASGVSNPLATNTPAITNAPVVSAAAQQTVAREINNFIQKTRSGAIGVTGMIILIIVAIRMLSSIEETFNDIWGVTCGRNWFLRVVIYWTTITLGPLLLAAALGLAGGSQFSATRSWFSDLPFIGSFIFPTLTLVVLWLAFALFYKAVPNTKVHFGAALVGGMVAGTLWHLNNVFGFLYVSTVATNSKIYGGLGLVPVFMAGLYLSWLMLLFGAQVAYAFQNRALYLQEKLAENVNQRGREFVALRLMTFIGEHFQRGQRPPTIQGMSADLGIPSRLIQQVLQTLIAAHLVIEIAGAEPAYTPARPLEDITAHHILQAMRATQGQELLTRDEPGRAEVYGEFARIQDAEKQAASTISILALVNRAHARLELAPTPPPANEDFKVTPALAPQAPPNAGQAASDEVKPGEQVEVVSTWSAPEPKPVTKPEPTAAARPIAEPSSDEERDFPL
jgi:membrane protein